ncbi:MAG TPA: cytochrome c [Nitrospinota bacterium]|nr:cytochrome c [Nitrospinota bacterium]
MKKYVWEIVALGIVVIVAVSGSTVAASDVNNGKRLWKKAKCNTCHYYNKKKKKVGPTVMGVTKKRSEAWLVKWLKDPQGTWEENDAETQEMRKWKKRAIKAKRTKMKIKKLSDEQVADLVAFLKANDKEYTP